MRAAIDERIMVRKEPPGISKWLARLPGLRRIWHPQSRLLPAQGATVRVEGPHGPVVLYANATDATTLSNPLIADGDGFVRFWVDEGSYRFIVNASGGHADVRFWATPGPLAASQ